MKLYGAITQFMLNTISGLMLIAVLVDKGKPKQLTDVPCYDVFLYMMVNHRYTTKEVVAKYSKILYYGII
jgi:hypothetical protein